MRKTTPLRRAVDYLMSQGKINMDKDIAEDLKLTHGPISTYLNGKAEPSKPFLKKFESHYGIKLSDFENETLPESEPRFVVHEPSADYKSKYIERLEQLVDTNLKTVVERLDQMDKNHATLYSFLEIVLEEVIASRAKTEKQAQEISVSAHKRFVEKLAKIQ